MKKYPNAIAKVSRTEAAANAVSESSETALPSQIVDTIPYIEFDTCEKNGPTDRMSRVTNAFLPPSNSSSRVGPT
jgi:hypothetical protein